MKRLGRIVRGDVVVVPFPFSDLSQAKRRPTLVVATLTGNDVILCQITSDARKDAWAIAVEPTDISDGSLNKSSNIRPNRLFTCDSGIILYRVGSLRPGKLTLVLAKILELFAP
ncbi:MAG: type II toxin-antitoxin system PemK/MazF family toxin [Acaryochloridaceae cyanobacterium RL_2_7]|nr:type II toxin-antitoxin system PemK/MazF family toxin [Acaryochloridaceae cyanobacterium RL_2_7]